MWKFLESLGFKKNDYSTTTKRQGESFQFSDNVDNFLLSLKYILGLLFIIIGFIYV